jgi:DNA excision repair protein ERCC-2
MQNVLKIAGFNLPLLVEEKRTKISDVLRFFKTHENCVVCGVARGKISEGVDITDEGQSLLSGVVIVGLPYPKKTELQEALYRYFEEKFGDKALEYSNGIPCLNALAQSAGRLIRSSEDKGIIVVMDRRAAGRFKWRLPADWREEIESYMSIDKIVSRIKEFTNKELD